MLMLQTSPDEMPTKKKKRRSRPSSSGMLVFIAAFLVCILIFVGIAALWWHIAKPDLPFLPSGNDTTTTTTASADKTVKFGADERFSVAVYITDDNGDLQTATLALMQPDGLCATTLGLPAELALFDTDYDTLERRFNMDGPDTAQMALGVYFAQPIDYYVVASYSQVESYFTQLGQNLIVKLNKNVDQQPSDGSFSIHLTAGEQALSPKQTANLLRCDNYQGGKKERAEMHATVVDAYIDQFLSASRDIQADLVKLQANCETNLSGERYNTVDAALTYLTKNNSGALCNTMATSGSFEGAGEFLRFTPSEATVQAVKNALRPLS